MVFGVGLVHSFFIALYYFRAGTDYISFPILLVDCFCLCVFEDNTETNILNTHSDRHACQTLCKGIHLIVKLLGHKVCVFFT